MNDPEYISELQCAFRNGQLFVQWQEKDLPADARLSVWRSPVPFERKFPAEAELLARWLNPGSAGDWWLDVDSFLRPHDEKLKNEEIFAGNAADNVVCTKNPRGFVIENGGMPLNPDSGLHVHTPRENGWFYYAVAVHSGFDEKILMYSATAEPVWCDRGKITPICFSGKITENCGKGLPVIIRLHGRGGGVGVDENGNEQGTHLFFADETMAWREGIPFKFEIKITADAIELTPYDRIWTGRIISETESSDARDHVPAVATFWLGYNVNIGRSNLGPDFIFDNYTERWILFLTRWAQDFLGGDARRTYIIGGSMGGTGAVQLITHFPAVFAAAVAWVPIYSYTWKKLPGQETSAWRLTCSGGPFTVENPAVMPDGKNLLEYADAAANIAHPEIDFPPLFATNGRQDKAIPWVNNPPFYNAANDAKQQITVFWNNGGHDMSDQVPDDMRFSEKELFKYSLDHSFPAFSNCSDNRDFCSGKADAGWINRGFYWKDIVDEKDSYEITLQLFHPEIKYPVTVDVTIRRRQNFHPSPGSVLNVFVNGHPRRTVIDENGVMTIKNILFASADELKIHCCSCQI